MSFPAIRALRVLALSCLALSAPSRADWALSSDLAAVRPLPDGYQVQAQNPPSFTWSRDPAGPVGYTLELTRQGATPVLYKGLTRNWLLPSTKLAAGTYSWRVNAVLKDGSSKWSSPRTFVIDATSKDYIVPENAALKATALAHGRSRQLPANFTVYAKWTPAMLAERGATYRRLVDDVVGHTALKSLSDADWTLPTTSIMTAALTAQNTDIRQRISLVGHQAEAAALLYRLSGNTDYRKEALRRGNELASLSPTGATSYTNQDQGTRQIAVSLIKTADYLWGDAAFDATTRGRWLAMVATRTDEIYRDLAGSDGRLDQYPFDSHGSSALGYLAEIAVLSIGDVPAAQAWFDFALRAYIHTVSVWSGAEGGYANGTAYGQVSIDYFLSTWTTLAQVVNVNLFNKPWATGFLRFFAEFTPPGQLVHVFGDGHEDIPNQNVLRAFASRFATPDARWYYDSLVGGNEDGLTLLVTPSPLPVSSVASTAAAPPPNSMLYPSIGWVAMHSKLADPARTSVYFKSSQFGAYNHSHGDQNSLVLLSAGRPLLIEAGYYDWYGSPLWTDWYRQTKSHNAITYVGAVDPLTGKAPYGVGQRTDGNNINLARTGRITNYKSLPEVEYAEGDAYPAYEGVLTTALRKIWYVRGKDVVVVLDTLGSASAKKFEWNLHAAQPIKLNGDGSVTIVNATRSVCVRTLTPKVAYEARSWPVRPNFTEAHGAFVSPALTSAEFLMVLDVGCKGTAVSLSTTVAGRTLTVGGQVLNLPK